VTRTGEVNHYEEPFSRCRIKERLGSLRSEADEKQPSPLVVSAVVSVESQGAGLRGRMKRRTSKNAPLSAGTKSFWGENCIAAVGNEKESRGEEGDRTSACLTEGLRGKARRRGRSTSWKIFGKKGLGPWLGGPVPPLKDKSGRGSRRADNARRGYGKENELDFRLRSEGPRVHCRSLTRSRQGGTFPTSPWKKTDLNLPWEKQAPQRGEGAKLTFSHLRKKPEGSRTDLDTSRRGEKEKCALFSSQGSRPPFRKTETKTRG